MDSLSAPVGRPYTGLRVAMVAGFGGGVNSFATRHVMARFEGQSRPPSAAQRVGG